MEEDEAVEDEGEVVVETHDCGNPHTDLTPDTSG